MLPYWSELNILMLYLCVIKNLKLFGKPLFYIVKITLWYVIFIVFSYHFLNCWLLFSYVVVHVDDVHPLVGSPCFYASSPSSLPVFSPSSLVIFIHLGHPLWCLVGSVCGCTDAPGLCPYGQLPALGTRYCTSDLSIWPQWFSPGPILPLPVSLAAWTRRAGTSCSPQIGSSASRDVHTRHLTAFPAFQHSSPCRLTEGLLWCTCSGHISSALGRWRQMPTEWGV